MPPPTPLTISTSSLLRLIKEETSYHKELLSQEARLSKLEASTEEDENREYALKQEKAAILETKAVFPPLRTRIEDALAKLKEQLEAGEGSGSASEGEISKAREVIQKAEEVVGGGK